jgi:hypothetical protein
LHDAVARASDPKIVFGIHGTTVGNAWCCVRIAEGIHDVAFGIEFDDHGRLMRGVQIVVGQVAPVQDEHMVARVNTDASDSSRYPEVRQRLGPVRIHFESRRLLRRQRCKTQDSRRKRHCRKKCRHSDDFHFHFDVFPLPLS